MSDVAQDILFIFPGQGSQYSGIGGDIHAEYAEARSVYAAASEVLGHDITDLSFHDPDGNIDLTRYTQPVLLTHSIACLQAFRAVTGGTISPVATAGHSVGEYAALVAAGAIRFEDALGLVQSRGNLMGTHGEGEMEALPFAAETATPLAEKHHCAIAACNLPEQTVVGGRADDLDRLVGEIGHSHPRKRTVRLKTEGAFHTYYMVSAALEYREVLAGADLVAPSTPVLSNFTGGFHDPDAAAIRSRLFFQLFHPVLWYQNLVNAVDAGATIIVEFGGGIGKGETPAEKRPNLEGVVKKALRRRDPPVRYYPVINTQTLQAAAAALAPD